MEGLPTFKGIICHIDLVIMYDFIWMRVLKFYLVICFSWQLDIDFDDMNPWHVYFPVLNEQFCSCYMTQMSAFCFVVTHVCCKWMLDFYCEEFIDFFIFDDFLTPKFRSMFLCFLIRHRFTSFWDQKNNNKKQQHNRHCFMNFWDQKNNNTDFKMLPHNNKFVKCLCCSSNHSVVQP